MTKFYTMIWICAAITIGLIAPIYIFLDDVLDEPPLVMQDFVR